MTITLIAEANRRPPWRTPKFSSTMGPPLCGGLLLHRLRSRQVVSGTLRVGGSGEDRPLVVFQGFQPGRDIGGVFLAGRGRQLKIGADERRAQLGDKLLHRIAFIAPPLAPEIPVEAFWVLRPVHFMPISA